MCNPTAIGLMVASAAVDHKNQSDANDRTNKQVSLSEERNDNFNKKMIAANDKNLEQYNPETRIDNLQANQVKNEDSITESLVAARDKQQNNEIAAQGKVSTTYEADKAERAIQRAKAASDLAKMISKVRAPSSLQNDEQMENAKTSTVMGTQAQHRGDMSRASFKDIQNAGKLDPTMQIMSGILRGASMAYGGGA